MSKIKLTNETSFPLESPNCEIEVVRLNTRTDVHNNVLTVERITPLKGRAKVDGKIFFIKDFVLKKSQVLVSLSPDCAKSGIVLEDYRITIASCSFPVAHGKCALGSEERLLRQFVAERMKSSDTYSMVNNWGDCNEGKNMGEDFVRNEIDAASKIGVDVVQIDDGWQTGSPAEARIYKENGDYSFYHTFDGDFWNIDKAKFPNGLSPLTKYAKEKGVTLGLWFAPDSREYFKNMKRDLDVLKQAYAWGFRYFKLDMTVIDSQKSAERFDEFLKEVSNLGSDVFLQIDVTGDIERMGFLCGFEYGRIFVENRSCKMREYYPHTTLKNLWKLARYIPARLLQIEVPNPKKFSEHYLDADALAPKNYDIDYLFAQSMVANPLLWTEAQHLDESDAERLKAIVGVWQKHKASLSKTDAIPVGCEPNGCSLTGFLCVGDGYGYVLAFREFCDEAVLEVPTALAIKNTELLAANNAVSASVKNKTMKISFSDVRSYAFLRFEF